ncbi:MAG: RNA polymerase sigma factor [Gemmatimonadetes bacterium]|nr:RNA polymerase sigma factor [Gemmatimonadota bacterium]
MPVDVAALYAQHHAALFRYVARLTGDHDLAADAVQETFTRLLEKAPREGNTKAWLFTVATNLVRAWSNSRKRRQELLEAAGGRAPAGDAPPTPEEETRTGELRQAVRRALDELGEKERTILLMREEGFSHREIAEAVGTTTGSVGTMIARALDKLAERLPLDADDV